MTWAAEQLSSQTIRLMAQITKQWVSTSHSDVRIRSFIEGRSIWVALFLLIETFIASPYITKKEGVRYVDPKN